MATYPTTPIPSAPYQTNDTFKTLQSPEYDSGIVITKSLRNYPKYSVTLTYGMGNSAADIQTLYQFFLDHKGSATTFTFIDFMTAAWPRLYAAVGNASTQIFDVPMAASTSYTLWVDGVDQVATYEGSGGGAPSAGHWKFYSAAGTGGRDQIKFGTAPALGKLIEWKATGQRVINARFSGDVMSLQTFYASLATTGLTINEVKG